jgi:BirA family biotin operon repressor/biotin-[acetyl-CoA-carboxylase] ligase
MTAVQLSPAYRLVALDETGSTNDEAKRLAREGAADKTLVWAKAQTAGRGRGGRSWISPAGNLYLSLVLRPDCPAARAAELGFVAAVALVAALDRLSPGLDLAFKWPNDVLFGGGKLAGILIEAESGTAAMDWLVLGLGVNVATAPAGTELPAAALSERGSGITVEALLAAFADDFLAWTKRWQAEGFSPVRQAWLARARGLGQPVSVRLPNTTLRGTFVDLDADGALVLGQTDGGETRRVTAGDVFFGWA